MFIRVYNSKQDKEILLNVDHIWKVEVTYAIKDPNTRMGYQVSLKQGIENPDAFRVYEVFFGGDKVTIAAPPDDLVRQALEEIYKSAIKSGGKKKPDESDDGPKGTSA
jgi:hypothetical protein